jgi:hypothetical protein
LTLCTLPKEGTVAWEINPSIATLIKEKRFSLNVHGNFFLVCAKSLPGIYAGARSRDLYDRYAEMIVTKYECLKDKAIPDFNMSKFKSYVSFIIYTRLIC